MAANASVKPYEEIVHPSGAGREALYVITASVVVVVLAAVLITVRRTVPVEQELAEYQMSAFSGLNSVEQGIYNDLLAASLEIDLYHADTLTWPRVEQLQEFYIPPFAKDLSWKQRGALAWKQDVPNIELQHTVSYFALSNDYDVTGSFILWMTHKHNMTGPMAQAFMQERGGGMPLPDDPLLNPMGNAPLAAPEPAPIPEPSALEGEQEPPPPLKPQVRVWYHPGPEAGPPGLYLDQHLIRAGWRELIAYTGTEETERLKGPAL